MKFLILYALSALMASQVAFAQINDAQSFNSVITDVVSIYDGELPSERKVDINWESETKNASAGYVRGKVTLTFHGGFVRSNKLTKDAFAIIVCHEVGHIIGGYPKVMPTQKYTSEGQSDYFAATDCIKKYFVQTKEFSDVDLSGIDEVVIAKCKQDILCLRGLAAIRDVSIIYPGSHINAKTKEVSRFTIFNDYPSSQCRVDTLKAGLLRLPRPACWFRTYQKERYEYDFDKEYEEALGVADIIEITPTEFGCHIRTKYPSLWQESYLTPLSEAQLMMKGVYVIGHCRYEVGDTLSGTMTLVHEQLYLNVNSNDK